MNIKEEIEYWIETTQNDLHCFETEEKKNIVKDIFLTLAQYNQLSYYVLEGRKGVIGYCIHPDFRGNLTLDELFLYIKREYRGNVRLFKELVNHIEQLAKENGCESVRIGANLKYKDQKILKALKLLGYETDVVVKYIGGK